MDSFVLSPSVFPQPTSDCFQGSLWWVACEEGCEESHFHDGDYSSRIRRPIYTSSIAASSISPIIYMITPTGRIYCIPGRFYCLPALIRYQPISGYCSWRILLFEPLKGYHSLSRNRRVCITESHTINILN